MVSKLLTLLPLALDVALIAERKARDGGKLGGRINPEWMFSRNIDEHVIERLKTG